MAPPSSRPSLLVAAAAPSPTTNRAHTERTRRVPRRRIICGHPRAPQADLGPEESGEPSPGLVLLAPPADGKEADLVTAVGIDGSESVKPVTEHPAMGALEEQEHAGRQLVGGDGLTERQRRE